MWLGALQKSLDSEVSDPQACSSRAFLEILEWKTDLNKLHELTHAQRSGEVGGQWISKESMNNCLELGVEHSTCLHYVSWSRSRFRELWYTKQLVQYYFLLFLT